MKRSIAAWLLIPGIALLGACEPETDFDTDPAQEVETFETEPAPETMPMSYHAELRGLAGHEGASGTVTADVRDGETIINVELAGGVEAQSHSWEILEGRCDTEDDGTLGGLFATYPDIEVNAQGHGVASTTIGSTLEAGQQYHVNIYHPEDDDMVLACGDLQQR